MIEEDKTPPAELTTSEPLVGRVRAESIAEDTPPPLEKKGQLSLIIEGDEEQTIDSPSSQEVGSNDQPPALTPDPKQKTLTTEGDIQDINEDDKRSEEGSQIGDEDGDDDGKELSEERSQIGDEDGDDNGKELSEEGSQIGDEDGDDNGKASVETEESSLEVASINNGASSLLTGLVTSFTASMHKIEFHELPNKAIKYSYKATDHLKSILPEDFKISPEMYFAGGAITGTAINPALRYTNDQLTGNNKDLSLFDYYSWKGFSASNTMKSFAYMVGKSHLTFYGIDLIKSHLLSDNAAKALTAVMSYCKATIPMTFTVGLVISTAPQTFDLAYNVIDSSLHTLTSLAGLSSSDNSGEMDL